MADVGGSHMLFGSQVHSSQDSEIRGHLRPRGPRLPSLGPRQHVSGLGKDWVAIAGGWYMPPTDLTFT